MSGRGAKGKLQGETALAGNLLLMQPFCLPFCPLWQFSQILRTGIGQRSRIDQQRALLKDQSNVGMFCTIPDTGRLLRREELQQIGFCKFQMPLPAHHINIPIDSAHSFCNQRNIPGDVPEAMIGQIKAEILSLHQTFFRAFSRFARSRSCFAMISTSCS